MDIDRDKVLEHLDAIERSLGAMAAHDVDIEQQVTALEQARPSFTQYGWLMSGCGQVHWVNPFDTGTTLVPDGAVLVRRTWTAGPDGVA